MRLDPGESIGDAMTLMRGAEGALFGSPGVHEIRVEVHWDADGMVARVAGSATVMVTAAVTAGHAAAAHKVLATPDAHLVLAIGGDHLEDGIQAIKAALDEPVLRPHFAVIEAKRLARRFGKRKPDMKAAAALIDDAAVMSGMEAAKMATDAQGQRREGAPAKDHRQDAQEQGQRSGAAQRREERVGRAVTRGGGTASIAVAPLLLVGLGAGVWLAPALAKGGDLMADMTRDCWGRGTGPADAACAAAAMPRICGSSRTASISAPPSRRVALPGGTAAPGVSPRRAA